VRVSINGFAAIQVRGARRAQQRDAMGHPPEQLVL
jgi:hypothetical protein